MAEGLMKGCFRMTYMHSLDFNTMQIDGNKKNVSDYPFALPAELSVGVQTVLSGATN